MALCLMTLICTTIPIPKGGSTNVSVSDNNGITLSSVFGRLIDLVFLMRYSKDGLVA